MVKTIFYFCPTEEEYNSLKDNAELSARTIVFVENTRAIYLNGKQYGQGAGYVTEEEFNTEKDNTNLRFTALGVQLDQTAEQVRNELNEARIQLETTIDALLVSVSGVQTDISQVSDDLDEFKETIREEVQQDITDAVTDSDGKNIWTRMSEADNGIQRIYNKIDEITDEDGNIEYTEALQSVISTGIANDASFNELQNRWALVDENENVLKWMATGFTSQAEEGESFAAVFAALVDESMPGYKSAFSNIQTRVQQLENADYVATANLQTEVESLLGTTLASLALKSDVESASIDLSARLEVVESWEDNIDETIASISADVTKNGAAITQLATFDSGTQSYSFNKATLDEAVASLLAQGSGYDSEGNVLNIATACINAQVKGNQSWITLSADQINLDGTTIAQRLIAANAAIGGWNISNNALTCSVTSGEEDEEERSIRLISTVPEIRCLYSPMFGTNSSETVMDTDGFHAFRRGRDGYDYYNSIGSDGTGSLANGNLVWDVNGNVDIVGTITATAGSIGSWTIDNGKLTAQDENLNSVQLDPTQGLVARYVMNQSYQRTSVGLDGVILESGDRRTQQTEVHNALYRDGSGLLGNGSISWNTDGELTISNIGTFSSVGEDEYHNTTETTITNGEVNVNTTTPNDDELDVTISSGFVRLKDTDGEGYICASEMKVESEDNNGSTIITGGNINTYNVTAGGNADITGNVDAASFSVGGTAGYNGTIVIGNQTITVTNGIITGVTNGAA